VLPGAARDVAALASAPGCRHLDLPIPDRPAIAEPGGAAADRPPARENPRWGYQRIKGAYDTDTLIGALEGLRRFLGGQKATLVWDGLPAHRSHAMHAWLRRQRSWLVVEPLPAYAPELNPVEPLWSSLKGVELANLAGDTLEEVIAAAERGIQRIRHTHHL
jgi:transposase